MANTKKALITIQTDLDKHLSTFQSTDAKYEFELIEMAVSDNHTEIEDKELNDETVTITITDANASDGVVKSLNAYDFTAEVVDRKAWLLEQKKKRKAQKNN